MVILDTASGINITHDNSLLLHYKPFDTPLTNFYGVGSPDQQSPIKLVGEGYLLIKVSRKNIVGVHALYCPDEDSTILSVIKLHRDIGLIISPDLKQVTIGKRKIPTIKDGDILQVKGDLIIKGLNSHKGEKRVRVVHDSYKPKKISSYEAHLRLNHLAPSVIQKSVANHIFVDVDELSDQKGFRKSWCEICASGKATRQFHYTDSMNDYSAIKEPGESWSADTFGPLNKLPQGTDRYFLLMVDTVSRYLIVTTHKSKDEATISKQLLHNIAWIKTQFGRQFKELITDRGTEFKNKRMEEICSSQGIQHIFTPKQDHAANARAERNNRTMLDDARTLLLQSGLRFKYWTYAVRAAADIRNMTYNKEIGTAPLLLLSSTPRIIKLVNFIPFGADAIVWQPTDHKLQPRGIRGTILCRDPNSFGYFVLLHKENKIISTRNFRIPNLIFEKGHIDKMLGNREYDEECGIIEQEMRVPRLLDDEVSSEEDNEPFYPPDYHKETAGMEHNQIHHSVQSDSHLSLSLKPGSFRQQEPLDDSESSYLSGEEDMLSDKDPDNYESDHLDDEGVEKAPTNNTDHEGSQTTHDNITDIPNEPEVFPSTATSDVTLDTVGRSSSDNVQDHAYVAPITTTSRLERKSDPKRNENSQSAVDDENILRSEPEYTHSPSSSDDEEVPVQEEIDPNDIDKADLTPLLGEPASTSTSTNPSALKRVLSDEETESESDIPSAESECTDNAPHEKREEVFSIPKNLREDIVGKENVIDLPDGPIAKRTRQNKKLRVREVKSQVYRIRFVAPLENWEKGSKVYAIYYKDAITNNPDPTEKELFKAAFTKEYNNLINMKVIDPKVKVRRTSVPSIQVIPTNTIFTVKRSGEHKARIVARGDKQDTSTYDETTTSNLNIESLKLLLIEANNRRWYLKSIDINFAFLHAKIDKKLYIPHPTDRQYVTPLLKSLYGLKQSPKLWNDMFREAMRDLHYHDSAFTPGLYVASDGKSMIGTYVDDCVIAAESTDLLERITSLIEEKFSVKTVATMQDDIFQADVLGIDLRYDRKRGIISMSLETYINTMVTTYYQDVVEKTGKIVDVPHSSLYDIIPQETELVLSKVELKKKIKMLQEKIGRLNYVRTHGRVDIEFAVAKIARFVLFPHKKVVSAVGRIIKYLYDTKGQSLNFIREPRPNCVRVFTDSSHASEYDRMSRHGYLVFYGRNLIGYASKKSSLICKSSSAAELDALNMGEEAGSMYGIKLENVTGRKMAITYFIDSQTVLNWMEQEYWKGNRFLGVKIEYLKIELRMKKIKIHKIKGIDNPADILTKPVTKTQFETLVRIMEAGYTADTD